MEGSAKLAKLFSQIKDDQDRLEHSKEEEKEAWAEIYRDYMSIKRRAEKQAQLLDEEAEAELEDEIAEIEADLVAKGLELENPRVQ